MLTHLAFLHRDIRLLSSSHSLTSVGAQWGPFSKEPSLIKGEEKGTQSLLPLLGYGSSSSQSWPPHNSHTDWAVRRFLKVLFLSLFPLSGINKAFRINIDVSRSLGLNWGIRRGEGVCLCPYVCSCLSVYLSVCLSLCVCLTSPNTDLTLMQRMCP